MIKTTETTRCGILVLIASMMLPGIALAETDYEALQSQVQELAAQLAAVQQALAQLEQGQAEAPSASVADIAELKDDVATALEWRTPSSLIHMAGYTDVGYVNAKNSDGTFVLGSFAPIFHFQYRDKVMFESELEFEISPDGETEVAMEYLTIDYFLNDYMTLVAGSFLSPIGQFRQNLHPSWINKLASAPPGFGHDGAAPTADLGLQLRGGFPIGKIRSNYAVYVGNGPELNAAFDDGEFELEGIAAESFGVDRDGEKVVGGRFALLPVSNLEIGVSALTGKATVTGVEDELSGAVTEVDGAFARDYDVVGADYAWSWNDIKLRGEYVRSKVGEALSGPTASAGGIWKSWYSQAAWRIPSTNYEAVMRFADFDTPNVIGDQKQWAVGLNYLITNSFIAKGSYEFNDGVAGSSADTDRLMLQLAYGF